MDVIDWLLDADPAIRWQVLRDLTRPALARGGELAVVVGAAAGGGLPR